MNKSGGIFLYTSLKSAKLTRIISVLFCILLLVLMIMAPFITKKFIGTESQIIIRTAITAFYICSPAAWAALISILKLMTNIINGKIFIKQNVFCMRLLSWLCAYVAAVCFGFGFVYSLLFVFSLGAAFMMLILRVLKSVMAMATEIKDENELTI